MPTDDDPTLTSVEAYGAHADDYERRYADHRLEHPRRFAASLVVPARILDAGCGPGRDLGIFASYGHEPVGFELNDAFVEMARRHAPTVAGDLREVAEHFDDASFDGVWAQASLVHLSKAAVVDVLGQFARLLRPGGRFFTCVKAEGDRGWIDEPDGRRWYEVWDADEFAAAVDACGFEIEDLRPGFYVEVWATRR